MTTPLLENILNQATALQQIAGYQFGDGKPSLERAASLIRSKKRILLSGMGASLFAAIPFQYALAEHGFQVAAIETGELLYFLQSAIDADTVVVLVSRSGESVEVTRLLAKIRERAAAVIGVVNVPASTLADQSDEAILIGSPTDQFVAIQTYTGTLAVLALLAAELLGEAGDAHAELLQTADLLSRALPECAAASEHWREFLLVDTPLYLLGRGSSLAAVAEGVLLMHETAKLPAIGMSAAQFRHGPVEVTEAGFRAIVIGTQPPTRELDAALAQDLMQMGGRIRWLGPAVRTGNLALLYPWPDGIPRRFHSIAEIIPLQLAAYRAAELRGIRPGDFRWAPLVTRSEAGFSIPSPTQAL